MELSETEGRVSEGWCVAPQMLFELANMKDIVNLRVKR